MNLKEKLARLDRDQSVVSPQKERPQKREVSDFLPGEKWDTEAGACRLIRSRYPFRFTHGTVRLGALCQNNAGHIALLNKDPALNSVPLQELLFIDTETTGLSGGIGTVAFLVGIGYFEGEQFVIDQFFMRDFSDEPGVLHSFLHSVERVQNRGGAIVSFNGKSFDLPLLFNRAVFHRFLRSATPVAHIDLLHPARRFWKKSLPDCTLGTLETHLLKIRRSGDVPGFMIPEIYFRFLRSQDPRPLLPVFYHNQMDILSLVGILHIMLQIYSFRTHKNDVPVDWPAAGSAFEEIGKYDEGLRFHQNLLAGNLAVPEKKEIFLRMARLHKKQQNYASAIEYWQQAVSLAGFSAEPYEELAKVYEHRIVDLQRAKKYTAKALENVRLLEQLRNDGKYAELKSSLLWRLNRIKRKLGEQ